MATLNKTVSGYVSDDKLASKSDIIMRIVDNGKNQSFSLSTFDGVSISIPLDKQIKSDLIKALGE